MKNTREVSMNNQNKTVSVTLLSIDAWRYDHGWNWNNWFRIQEQYLVEERVLSSPRMLLAKLRRDGFLLNGSQGRLAIEDDGYNVVVVDKNTYEPLLALEYGHNH